MTRPANTDSTEWNLRFQGAESKIWFGKFQGVDAVKKERFVKKYRAKELDERLTKQRIRAEVRAINKIKDKCKDIGQLMPDILSVDDRNIVMSAVEDAKTACRFIDEATDAESVGWALKKIGTVVAQIHNCGVVHGDLTTSNFLISNEQVIPIDFGLAFTSNTAEDRGVDLYVLERALISTHVGTDFSVVLTAYANEMGKASEAILKKLDEVRMRGRKRTMVG